MVPDRIRGRHPLSLPGRDQVDRCPQLGPHGGHALQQGFQLVGDLCLAGGAPAPELISQRRDRAVQARPKRVGVASPPSAVQRVGYRIQGRRRRLTRG